MTNASMTLAEPLVYVTGVIGGDHFEWLIARQRKPDTYSYSEKVNRRLPQRIEGRRVASSLQKAIRSKGEGVTQETPSRPE